MTRHLTVSSMRIAGCLAILLAVSACNGFTVHRHAKKSDPFAGYKERPVGMLSFNEENADESTRRVHLYKIHKGYALKSRLDRTEDRATDFVISKDKDKDWFSGIQMKWVF